MGEVQVSMDVEPVEVDTSLPLEGGMPAYSASVDTGLQQNVQGVELAIGIPLESGDVQPLWKMAPTAEVPEAHLKVDASPALESELCEYGAPDAGLEPSAQKVEVAVNMQGSSVPQEMTVNDGEECVLIAAEAAGENLEVQAQSSDEEPLHLQIERMRQEARTRVQSGGKVVYRRRSSHSVERMFQEKVARMKLRARARVSL